MRRALALLALALAACHRDPPAPAASASASGSSGVAVGSYSTKDGGQTLTVNGYTLETAPDLPEREGSTTTTSGDNQTVVVLRGWSIVIRDGKVAVAGRDFGAAPAGSTIRVAKDGVRVGGELRGPLP